MYTKILRYISLAALFLFPFALTTKVAFPASFTHVMFMFTVIEVLVFLFLFKSLSEGRLRYRKSVISAALITYIAVLILTAITGSLFGYAFWGNYTRMMGIVTWLHYTSFFFVLSSIMTSLKDWKNVFRTLALSSIVLVLFSYLGRDGLGMSKLSFLVQGGSFLGNTSYAGAYELLIFFFSIIGLSVESDRRWKCAYIFSMLATFFNPDLFNFEIWKGVVSLKEAFRQPTLFLGMARSSQIILWAGGIFTLILFGFHKLKDIKKTVVLSLVSLALLVGAYVYGFTQLVSDGSRLNTYYAEHVDPIRPLVWKAAVSGFKERPLLGYGNGNFFFVYQEGLDAEMILLEDPPWFDRAHNIVLDELVNTGLLGILVMLLLSVLVLKESLRLYKRDRKFYFLLIPFIFFFHFLQLQTFFLVDSSLLLMLVLLAFLVSHAREDRYALFPEDKRYAAQIVMGAIIITVFITTVAVAISDNRLLHKIRISQSRMERIEMIQKLDGVKTDPFETLRQLTLKFATDTSGHAAEIEKAGFFDNVAEEYQLYLDTFEHYYPKYQNHYRYLSEYANFINSSFIFGINDLEHGEDLARQALLISENYPYPYWILAINLYYQGRESEALEAAQRALELHPDIDISRSLYETMDRQIKSKSKIRGFMFLPSL